MIIQVDDREGKRIKYAREQYKTHDVELTRLETGDFVFNRDCAFEYKTLPDFISSVQSGRVFEQALRLNKEFKYPFVIIQGSDEDLKKELDKTYFLRKTKKKNKPPGFSKKNFYGAINRLNTMVSVLQCPTQKLCFDSMLNQARMSLDTSPINRKVVKTGTPAYLCLRYCITGVGPKTAEKIVNALGIKSIDDVLAVGVEDFADVKGVSLDKARLIYYKLHNG